MPSVWAFFLRGGLGVFLLFVGAAMMSTAVSAAPTIRPAKIEFAVLYDVDTPTGRFVAAEQLAGLRTASYILRDTVPGVNVSFRLEPSPSRFLSEEARRLAVDAVVRSGSYFGFAMCDWTVAGYLVAATRATGVPVVAPHTVDTLAFSPEYRHVINFRQGTFRDTLTMADHALNSASAHAIRIVVFARNVSGWREVVDSTTAHMRHVGLEDPVHYLWQLDEAFDAVDAVNRWVGGAASKAEIPTAAFLFLLPDDVAPLVSAASQDPRLDWDMTVFYAYSLNVPDQSLVLSWDNASSVRTSAAARQVFRHLYLVSGLPNLNDESSDMRNFFVASYPQFVASGDAPSDVPGQPYSPAPVRATFSGFIAGYTIMQVLGSMLDVTSAAFVDRLYTSAELFLNRTAVGPFHNFCSSFSNDDHCFCNLGFDDNDLFVLDMETGKYVVSEEYYSRIQERVPLIPAGNCMDLEATKLRFPIGLFILPDESGISATHAQAIQGMQLEADLLQDRSPLAAGFLTTVLLNASLWRQFPAKQDMFEYIALRYAPLVVVTDQLDPVALNLDQITLRWTPSVELEPEPLRPHSALADRVIQWSPYLADLAYTTAAYMGLLYDRGTPRVWLIGETKAMIELGRKALHTFQFGVWREQLLGTLECEEADVLINALLAEADAAPPVSSADGATALRPLVVVLMLDDVAHAKHLLARFAALTSGRAAVRRLLLVCPWSHGLVFEALQALRDSSSMVPSDSAVVFATHLPAFWLPYSPINMEMRAMLRTDDVSLTENIYTIDGVLATRLVHAVSSFLKPGGASAERVLEVLYSVKTFSALGVNLGPFFNEACDNLTVSSNRMRRTCQCSRAFRRFYVYDLLDWAGGRVPERTRHFFYDQSGCGVEFGPLLAVTPTTSLSTAALAGIGVGASVSVVLLMAIVYYATLKGRGRDVKRAPKNPNKPCAILFTDIQSSTTLWARAPSEMSEAVEQHHRIIRAALDKHDGYEVKTIGDSFMCAFRKAEDALKFAMAMQRGMAAATWPSAIDDVYAQLQEETAIERGTTASPFERYGLRVRAGAHWGVPSVQYDEVAVGYDYYGTVVNTAARVEGVGNGGQVLLSVDLWRELEEVGESSGDALADVDVKPLGPQPLRGLDQPLTLYQALPREMVHRRFGPLRLDVQVDDVESSATPANPSTVGDTTSQCTKDSVTFVRSCLHGELKKKPHLLPLATASVQILEALLSTSTAEWREETLHHVCKRWRVPYEKPKKTAETAAAAAGETFSRRKDIITLVAKSVVAADLKKKILLANDGDDGENNNMMFNITRPLSDAGGNANSRRASESTTSNSVANSKRPSAAGGLLYVVVD